MDPRSPRAVPSGELQNFRDVRFDGGLIQCAMSAFHRLDQQIVRELYAALQQVDTFSSSSSAKAQEHSARLIEVAQELGNASLGPENDPWIRKVVHDVRGGSLLALTYALDASEVTQATRHSARFLAADHMKIMRNAISGLDDAACESDQLGGLHGTAALEHRWTTAVLRNQLGGIEVRFDARWQGDFAQNCFEFSAVQRVIYNLLANASRFTADQTIIFHVIGVPEPGVSNIRFTFENLVTQAQQLVLEEQLQDRQGIFDDGVTRTSQGLGLGICADFVAAAYGIDGRDVALEGEYLGVTVEDRRFISWFHWPVVK